MHGRPLGSRWCFLLIALAACASPGETDRWTAKNGGNANGNPNADAGNGNGSGSGGNPNPDAGNGGNPNPGAGNGGGGNPHADAGLPDAGPPLRSIDSRRSLAVTEQPILARFSLERVLSQLVAQSGVPGLTATALFQQWWDTQNPAPGTTGGPHCDDALDGTGAPTLAGYPYSCRPAPAEGADASCDPFAEDSPCAFVPIGLFNRFDLAPEDGSNCGEHRIVYARASGASATNMRNLVIFEAVVPNPLPHLGLRGCRVIVDHWADLSDEDDVNDRAAALERFYFDGIANVEPVVHVTHFGELGGQVRTNQFMQPQDPQDPSSTPRSWSLREFLLVRACSSGACSAMSFVPVTVKSNPWGGLFDPASTHPNAAAFRAWLPTQAASLASGSLLGFGVDVPPMFDSGQSQASGSFDTNYAAYFGAEPSSFASDLASALSTAGSALAPDDLVRRMQALSCAGCHRLSNDVALGGGLVWPSSIGFVHVTEREAETVDGVVRFRLSPALVDVFLPHRRAIVEGFLNDLPRPPRPPKAPLGGLRTH